MGFTGPTGNGVQYNSIEVDANGLSGADNSHYLPGSNRLAFGHGCVDDNEDADVIWHEYGHAINHSINNSYFGGDTGGMGEGFGDYWAGTHSVNTMNGDIFRPEWVFTWDGHGVPVGCWNGRLLNRTDVQYDPSQTYGAHQTVNGVLADELWSAPLFKTLNDLIGMGHPRDETDQIILEAQFGLGSGITMRVMGNAIVDTALNLYPGGPHANTFATNLAAQNIIEGDPCLTSDLGAEAASDLQAACAGRTVQLSAAGLSGAGSYTYEWEPAAGLSDPNAANPTISIAATTTFTCTVSDAQGCSVNVMVTVYVVPTLEDMLDGWGNSTYQPQDDANGDGVVNIFDLTDFIENCD
jgi:hypothetical protein